MNGWFMVGFCEQDQEGPTCKLALGFSDHLNIVTLRILFDSTVPGAQGQELFQFSSVAKINSAIEF